MGLRDRRRRRKKRKGNGRGRTSSRSSLNIYNFPPYQITVFRHLKWIVEQGNDQPTVSDNLGIVDNDHDLAAFNSQHWGMGKSSLIVQDMVGNEFFPLSMEEEVEHNICSICLH